MENLSLFISILSFVISAIVVILAKKSIAEQIRISKLNINYLQALEAHKLLMEKTELLELHDISDSLSCFIHRLFNFGLKPSKNSSFNSPDLKVGATQIYYI